MAITWGQIIERTHETPYEALIKMKNTVQQEKKSTGKYQKVQDAQAQLKGHFLVTQETLYFQIMNLKETCKLLSSRRSQNTGEHSSVQAV